MFARWAGCESDQKWVNSGETALETQNEKRYNFLHMATEDGKAAWVIGFGRSGQAANAVLAARGDDVHVVERADLVVVSPGVRVMSELEFGVRELKTRGVRLLAVTGSKGKSSVVKLVADALVRAGRRACRRTISTATARSNSTTRSS